MQKRNKIISATLLFSLLFYSLCPISFAKTAVQAVQTETNKYPDYSRMYIGDDKYESFNRKMFSLNRKLNKYVAKPVHIIWSSIMPQYGMDRIRNAYNNIEYPKRLASCLIQRDGAGVKTETLRFITNSTIGLGGLFDPAKKIFKAKPTNENMEQALCKCKMCSGSYLVMPCLNSCTPRSLCGRALEAALDPSVYLATPITAIVKFGLMVNRTSYMQPIAKMIENDFADPYDIQKKLYGIENYIKNSNLDRKDLLTTNAEIIEKVGEGLNASDIEEEKVNNDDDSVITGAASSIDDLEIIKKEPLKADIELADFNPQTPIVDSMRTALFDDSTINKSIWNELSIWNRSFAKRIKTGSINISEDRDNYKYRYILQKDKNAPLIILYPSIGESSNTHHSVVFAKIFYDEGYSVVMLSSHFNWEFAKSMPAGFCPGLPSQDINYIKLTTSKILADLQTKHECEFSKKIVIGTSFGAIASLFLANSESQNNTLKIDHFIAVSPPIELIYALEQLDKNSETLDNSSDDIKQKTAVTAAKILQLNDLKKIDELKDITSLPFSENEGKLIVSFILRQKLSDLIYTIENIKSNKKTDFYENFNKMNYHDYVTKYLLKDNIITFDDIKYETSLYSLANYFKNNNNYTIYESLDDFFTNKKQISKLKNLTGTRLIALSNGSHLGFLYRQEFLDLLKNNVKNINNTN